MRFLFTLSALALCACSGLPTVNAKKDWLDSIGSFQFVPLYPMREDINVGDIRMHRLSFDNTGLNSRTLGKIDKLPKPTNTKMALPKIDVTRVASADFEASGLIGLWNAVIGVKYNSEEALSVALTDLETAEVADVEIVGKFENQVRKMFKLEADTENDNALTSSADLKAICVGAKVMGDPNFEDTAISVVTRVGYARGIEYRRSSDTQVTVTGKANNANQAVSLDKADEKTTTTKTLSTPELFGEALAFGVDAIMISPKDLWKEVQNEQDKYKDISLVQVCRQITKGFITSPFSGQLTGALNRSSKREKNPNQ